MGYVFPLEPSISRQVHELVLHRHLVLYLLDLLLLIIVFIPYCFLSVLFYAVSIDIWVF